MCQESYCYWCERFFAAGDICDGCLRCVECCEFAGCHMLKTSGVSAWPPVTKRDLRTTLASRGGLQPGVADTILLRFRRREAAETLNQLAALLLGMGRNPKESPQDRKRFRHLVARLCRVSREIASLETQNVSHRVATNVLPTNSKRYPGQSGPNWSLP